MTAAADAVFKGYEGVPFNLRRGMCFVVGRETLLALADEVEPPIIDDGLLEAFAAHGQSTGRLRRQDRERQERNRLRREGILRVAAGQQVGTLLGEPCYVREGFGITTLPGPPGARW